MFFYFLLFFVFLIIPVHVQAASVYYLHSDHLGGTGVVTDPAGQIDELIDYHSFGEIRLDQQNSKHEENRKYIGQEHDESTGLDYLNARYYDSRLGKFISQDPEFWSAPDKFLIDPQQLNSYSYSRNNPIIYKDPFGLSTATYNPIPSGGWRFGQNMGQFNGVSAYYNGIGSSGITYSCVEYAKRYQSQIYGINNIGVVGSAKNMWGMSDTINNRLTQANSDYMLNKQVNGEGFALPQEGDLLFSTQGRYGHVMVVTESNFNNDTGKGHVEIIDQNASNKAVRNLDVKKTNKGYSVMQNSRTPLAGWFSPVKKNDSPKTSPPPVQNKQPSFWQKIWNSTRSFLKKLF